MISALTAVAVLTRHVRDGMAPCSDLAIISPGRYQDVSDDHGGEFLRIIALQDALRTGLDIPTAADVLWTVASPQMFLMLVAEPGWTTDRFEGWLGDTLISTLLP